MVAPGMIRLPTASPGISSDFRCEAVTCYAGSGRSELEALVEISLGIASVDFKLMAESYLGHSDDLQLRCANFMSCSLGGRLALILLELSENFGVADPKGVRLTVPARHRDIAELVGASRPRITEQLISFEKKHTHFAQQPYAGCQSRPIGRLLVAGSYFARLTARLEERAVACPD